MKIDCIEIPYNKHKSTEKYLNYDFIEEDLCKHKLLPKDYIKSDSKSITFVDHIYKINFDKTILITCKNGDYYLIRGILPTNHIDGIIYLDFTRNPKYYSAKLSKEEIITLKSSKFSYRFLKNFINECNEL